MHSEYFEGILQLRAPNKEILDFVLDSAEDQKQIMITKQKKVKNGIDLYFTSNKFLQSIGKRLKKKFCGELKTSTKLFSRNKQTSKDIFRLTVLFRHIPYKVGEIIEYNGDKIKILSLGARVHAKDISTGRKIILNYKDL